MDIAANPFVRIESLLGLHAQLQVNYVVDGYVATLDSQDGRAMVGEGKGNSVAEALADLERELGTPMKKS